MPKLRPVFFLLVSFLGALPYAHATDAIRIATERVHLGDIIPDVAQGLADVDLGPAPRPGRTLFLSYADLVQRLKSLGVAASMLELPKQGVRVESEGRVYTPKQLEALVAPAIRSYLPSGVELRGVHVASDRLLSPGIRAGLVRAGALTRRAGRVQETATVELLWDDEVQERLVVQLELEVAPTAVPAALPRGTVVSLTIVKGQVNVSVLAETLAAARVGEVVQLRTQSTKKIMSAKLTSSTQAEVSL